VAELDPNNPVAVCDVHVSQVDTYDGGDASTTPPVPHRADAFTYDGDLTHYGRLTSETMTSNDGGAPGSPLTVVHQTEYVWNDHVTAQSNSVTGVFLTTPVAFSDTEDGSAAQAACQYSSYDKQPWQGNVNSNSLVLGDLTQTDQSTNCGTTGAPVITTKYGYDAWGNRVGVVDPNQHVSCLVANVGQFTDCWYIETTFQVFQVQHTNILGQANLTFYDTTAGPSFGYGLWPTSTRDINSQSTTYRYDALGRLIGETLPGDPANANTISYAYSISCGVAPQPPCVEIDMNQFLGTTPTAGPMVARRFYDGWGHLVETRGISAGITPGPQDVVHFTDYDKLGRESAHSVGYFVAQWTGPPSPTNPTYATPNRTQPVTSTLYDGLGRATSVIDPLSKQTTNTIGVACNPVAGDSTCYLQILTADPLGHQSGSLVDAFGRTIYTQRFTGNQSSNYAVYATVQYTYDAAGRRTRILGPQGGSILESYDTAGRKIGLVDPDMGTENYTYDANGNVTKSVDSRLDQAGHSIGTTFIGYDALNRPLWRNLTNTPTGAYASFGYDSGTNGVGRFTSETFSGGSLSGQESFTYDTRGRQTGITLTIGSTAYPLQNSYTEADQLATQTYPTGEVVTYGYTALSMAATGWLTSLSTQVGSTTTPLLSGVDYQGPGGAEQQISNATLGIGSGAYTYAGTFDALARATDLKLSTAQTLFEQSRTFDSAGNVTTASTTLPTGTDNQAFCYDEQNRLTWAGATGTPPCGGTLTPGSLTAAQYQQSFAYDNLGRLTNGPAGAYSYGGPLHGVTAIASTYSASYDVAGNMTCRAPAPTATCAGGSPSGAKLTYDNEGRLTGWQNTQSNPTTTVAFLYDNEGNRVEQVVTQNATTTTTVYVGNVEQVATTGSSTTSTTYYYANGQRIALAVNGVVSYLASDRLGSAVVALNTSGSATASLLYAPYGGTRYSNGTMPTDYGFTGQHADGATGLDYYNARYYDPLAGQFTSADTILPGSGYDVFGLSRYAYVEGNPVVRTDPTGHCFPICAIIAGFVVGAAIVYGAQVIGNLQKGQGWHSFTTNINLGNVLLGGVAGAAIVGTLVAAPTIVGFLATAARTAPAVSAVGTATTATAATAKLRSELALVEGRDGVSAGLARAAELQDRAAQLQALRDPFLAENGTTATIQVQNRILLATDKQNMPKEWQGLLRSGEEFVHGKGDAEETILNSVTDQSEIVAGGTSRNVCIGICAPLIDKAGLELGGPQFPGSSENTAYRMFWRNLQ
jgi:RHS repeat-associated protein